MREQIVSAFETTGLKKGDVARRCGIHAADLSRYLKGRQELPAVKVQRMLRLLTSVEAAITKAGES